jgi:RNA polymerase primary sigma factor
MPFTDDESASIKPFTAHGATPDSGNETEPRFGHDERYDGNSCLRRYLAEIAKVKLLTIEEETALAARIHQGDDHAREHMIKANLRLVVKIAHDYEHFGIPLMDLISEGNIGLMKAVGRFDPAKGAKLSTYASWWIKQAIKRALANQSKTIRVPVHMVDKISHLNRAANRLHDVFGRPPTDEELGEELGISATEVANRRTASNRPVSLDAQIGGEGSNTFGEMVEDENAAAPFLELESKAVKNILVEILGTLSGREKQILVARFGLDGRPPQTLEDVGLSLRITRERVRQIQDKCLRKLRELMQKMDLEKNPADLREGNLVSG